MKEVTWRQLFQIFWSFLKIGPVTFGGGYAMIPLIEREVVVKRKWVKTEDVADIFALAESVPGAIGINSATFIGHRIAGVRGAIAAMIGILLPTFLIVILLSIIFLFLQGNPKMDAAFVAIRSSIVALIVYAAVKIGKTAIIDKTTIGVVAATVLFLLFIHVHPVLVILSGGFLGIVLVKLKRKLGFMNSRKEEEQKKKSKMIG
ncbi:chromate transporter [Bacillus sp. B15-48]|uniref:chromate transporter n=1 Tax=Bacillus sp. B15-48 TaxID=1548601 RepID=UPI00193ED438|nr:chromate transporter [Bacillus sp. B15-48]MBM4761855.1 chromate transporter [Bacillus sp. B15-48]